jgi:RNA polymerase sigma-70 factor (ECF subfamily)
MELIFTSQMANFDNLFLKYHHQLLRFTLKFLEDESEALDLVQDVFIAVWEKGKYREEEEDAGKVKAYLFAAMKNSCLNYLKHKAVVRKYEHDSALRLKQIEAAHYQSGEESLIEKEGVKQIEDAINSLSDIYKEVIVLGRLEGLKNSEIAEQLKIPVRTVETRIFRALLILKEKIGLKSLMILYFLGKK